MTVKDIVKRIDEYIDDWDYEHESKIPYNVRIVLRNLKSEILEKGNKDVKPRKKATHGK